jgi:hypothetical protein
MNLDTLKREGAGVLIICWNTIGHRSNSGEVLPLAIETSDRGTHIRLATRDTSA